MPLVRIDVLQGRTTDQLGALGDRVHAAMVETIGVPLLDRFQIVTEHPPGLLVFDPEYLGIHRTEGVVFVQITLNAGRTLEQKKALYAAIVRNLEARPGVRQEDVLVSLVEVPKENWSFGNGVAQYAP
jgi:phenylpyruvate tautomerase PptA (4-oxalocrotonate tautomerase family)